MKKLHAYIFSLEKHIDNHQHTNLNITKSTVGWQIDHTFKVINGIISVLQKSKPSDFNRSFNFKRSVLLTIKYIPRGKARAPQTVRSYEEIQLEDLKSQLEKIKNNLEILHTLDKNSNFVHPYFGAFNLNQSILFMEIHTHHHLKIIEDSLKNK